MKLIQIKLRDPNAFWLLTPITLKKGQEISPLINVDLLSDKQKELIMQSVLKHEIQLIDNKSSEVIPSFDAVKDSDFVAAKEKQVSDSIPDFASVTEPEVEPELEDDIEIPDDVYEEAGILLKKNGNTVKKTIKNLDFGTDTSLLLQACLELEIKGQQRKSIKAIIEKRIMEKE
jgi:hypothetical protein